MIIVNEIPILASVISILNTLNNELRIKGRSSLQLGKQINRYIMLRCPLGLHDDKRPSAGINLDSGVFHCFTCHTSYSLPKLVSLLLFDTDVRKFGETFLLDNFADYSVNHRESVLKLPVREVREEVKEEYVSEVELNKYAFYADYLINRGISKEILDLFDVGFDITYQEVTFPVRDAEGRCLFVARRSVRHKEFRYPKNIKKPLYGLDVLLRYGEQSRPVYIVESMINCLSLWTHNMQALALNGVGSDSQLETLKQIPFRRLILGFDGDEAGRKAIYFIYNRLKKDKLMTMLKMKENTDINDVLMQNPVDFKKIILECEVRII